VLRACPDGEGDWANEADQALVRTIRVKGDFTPEFVDHVCRDLARRHLPLLVDVGGRPKDWQDPIFAHCTHAILLIKDEASRRAWRDRAERHALPIVAELTSRRTGRAEIDDAGPVLRGTLTGLERGQTAAGPVLDALVERLVAIFAYDSAELRTIHSSLAPVETVVELDRLVRTFDVPAEGEIARWKAHHLPQVLDYLPEAVPLGLYGRAPNWLYAALALHIAPAPVHQFDVRLGWITPPALRLNTPHMGTPLQVQIHERPDHTRLEFVPSRAYIDYSEAEGLHVPPMPAGPSTGPLRRAQDGASMNPSINSGQRSGRRSGETLGLVLSGKLPHWLWTALALTYAPRVPWLAVYHPQWGEQAVIVNSSAPAKPVGTLIPSATPSL